MAEKITSGSANFEMTLNEIIESALDKVNMVAYGQNPSPQNYTKAKREINMILKSLVDKGVRLWQVKRLGLKLTASTERTSGGDVYTCTLGHTSSADTEPGTGVLWKMYWKLAGTAGAAAWATDTAYTCIADFLLDEDVLSVEKAKLFRTTGQSYDDVTIRNFFRYADIEDRQATGASFELCVHKISPQYRCYLYPQPDSATNYALELWLARKLQDFDSEDDHGDFPVRFYQYFVFRLAYNMSGNCEPDFRESLRLEADRLLDEAISSDIPDNEVTSRRSAYSIGANSKHRY